MQPTPLPPVDEILNPLRPDSIAVASLPLLPLDLPTTPSEPDFLKTVELETPATPSVSISYPVFPSIPSVTPINRPLSILDNAASAFPSFGVTKVFPPSLPNVRDPFDASLLSASLAHVLSAYPHFAGQLRLPRPDDVGRPHQKRYGRVWVEYGTPNDPGVSFTFSQRDEPVKAVLPREVGERVSDFGDLCEPPLVPTGSEVMEGQPTEVKRPGLAVCVTRFSDGAAVFGLRIAHVLSDATTMNRFVTDWSDVHRTLLLTGSIASIPLPSRPLSTEALEAHSAGDPDSAVPDPALEAQYRLLPCSGYDLWAHPELHPAGKVQTSALHPAVAAEDAARGCKRGEPAPWSTWDLAAPVLRRTVELSAEEVQSIWRRAQASSGAVKITAYNALAAHFWRLTVRARNLPPTTPVNFITGISARSRLGPSLPDTAVGSFVYGVITQVASGDLISPSGPFPTAALLRQTIDTATPSGVSLVLHHMSHHLDPTRMATLFSGSTHLGISSWIHSGSYAADFGTGAPSCSKAFISPVDGFFFADEVAGRADDGQKWWQRGVVMLLMLPEDVMERLLTDAELRG
ncbi:hypothetical protein JCM6882_006092 [Rhodosporidiobolus microsporus]